MHGSITEAGHPGTMIYKMRAFETNRTFKRPQRNLVTASVPNIIPILLHSNLKVDPSLLQTKPIVLQFFVKPIWNRKTLKERHNGE
jgi:hypothetical protein